MENSILVTTIDGKPHRKLYVQSKMIVDNLNNYYYLCNLKEIDSCFESKISGIEEVFAMYNLEIEWFKESKNPLFVNQYTDINVPENFLIYKELILRFTKDFDPLDTSLAKLLTSYFNKYGKCHKFENLCKLSFELFNSQLENNQSFFSYINNNLMNLNTTFLNKFKNYLNSLLMNFNKKLMKPSSVKWAVILLGESNDLIARDDILVNPTFIKVYSNKRYQQIDNETLINLYPNYKKIIKINLLNFPNQNFSNYLINKEEGDEIELIFVPFTKFEVFNFLYIKNISILIANEIEENLFINYSFPGISNFLINNEALIYNNIMCSSYKNIFPKISKELLTANYHIGKSLSKKQPTLALGYLENALKISYKIKEDKDFYFIKISKEISKCYLLINRIKGSEHAKSLFEVIKNQFGDNSIELADHYIFTSKSENDYEKSLGLMENALKILKVLYNEGNSQVQLQIKRIIRLCQKNNDLNRASLHTDYLFNAKGVQFSIYNDLKFCQYSHFDLVDYMKSYILLNEKKYGYNAEETNKAINRLFELHQLYKLDTEEFLNSQIQRLILLLDENSIEVAKRYDLIGKLFFKIGNYIQCLESLNNSLAIKKNHYDEDSPELLCQSTTIAKFYLKLKEKLKFEEIRQNQKFMNFIPFLETIGNYYLKRKKYTKANFYYSQLQKLVKNNSDEEAHLLIKIAECSQDRKEESDLIKKSLNIMKNIYGEKSIKYADFILLIVKIQLNKNHNDSALTYYETHLKIYVFNYGEFSNEVGQIIKSIGDMYPSDPVEKKFECYNNFLIIIERIYGNLNKIYLKACNEIALQSKSIDLNFSLKYLKTSMKIIKSIYGKISRQRIKQYNFLSFFYKLIDIQKSIYYQEKNIKLLNEIHGNDSIELANFYFSLSGFFDLKHSLKSIENAQNAKTLFTKLKSESSMEVAKCYLKLGELNLLLKNPKYIDFYNEAEKIVEKIGLDQDIMSFYKMISKTLKNKEPDKSAEYYEKYMKLKESSIEQENIELADEYYAAGFYYKNSDFKKALNYFNSCLRIKIKLQGEKSDSVCDLYNEIGDVLKLMKSAKSNEYYQKSLELIFILRGKNSKKAKIIDKKKDNSLSKMALRKSCSISSNGSPTKSVKSRNSLEEDKLEKKNSIESNGSPQSTKSRKSIILLNEPLVPNTSRERNSKILVQRKSLFGKKNTLNKTSFKGDEQEIYSVKQISVIEGLYGENSVELSKFYRDLGDKHRLKDKDKAIDYYLKNIKIKEHIYGEYSEEVIKDYEYVGKTMLYHGFQYSNIYFEKSEKLRKVKEGKKGCLII